MSTTAVAGPSPYAPPTGAAPAPADPAGARRIASLDIIRGAVMALMALDHVRVFSGVPAGGPDPAVFFTRWVTHFCAPAFIFLAGTAAWLYGRKLAESGEGRGALSRWLLSRGAWLILLELTVLRFGWTFNFDYRNFTFAGVIWVIGWCMILLAGLAWLPTVAVGALGVAIIALHNLLGGAGPAEDSALWTVLYAGGAFQHGHDGEYTVVVLYAILPWLGVIAAGYGFGPVMRMDPARRRRLCLTIGLGAIALFVLLRALDVYGDPRPWRAGPAEVPAALRFLNTAKYPASLLFLLMTLGPTIALIPLLEHARGRVARWLETLGRVPFFYYVLHIPLIHLVAMGIAAVRTPESVGWLVANHPMMPPDVPEGYRWSLPLLYAVTAAVVVALYFACRWYVGVKERRRDVWLLRYL